MLRRATAGLLVVGLGIGIWWLWPRGDEAGPPSTSAGAASITTTTQQSDETTTTVRTTTTNASHVVETVEEAEAILRELWFGWFEGIYLEDEDRIREVVATEEQVQEARDAFGALPFTARPDGRQIDFTGLDVLLSDENCLAIWSVSQANFLEPGPPREGVDIMRFISAQWRLQSSWRFKNDLWEADCDVQL